MYISERRTQRSKLINMKQAMSNNDLLNDILAHTDKSKLNEFIREYARDNEAFRSVFMEKFSPKPKPESGSKRKNPGKIMLKQSKRRLSAVVSIHAAGTEIIVSILSLMPRP